MLYLVNMVVNQPAHISAEDWADLRARERDYAQAALRAGTLRDIWRVVGEVANYSIFDVDSNEQLHDLISGLPLFPYMDITVIPLAAHPSTSA